MSSHLRATVLRATLSQFDSVLRWGDAHVSRFSHVWLRDHCPQSAHPTSNQRGTPLDAIDPHVSPSRLTLGAAADGQTLEVSWPAADEPSGREHTSVFSARWLRAHCYSDVERMARHAARTHAHAERARAGAARVAWEDVRPREGDPRASDVGVLACLESIDGAGYALITGVPGTVGATRALATQLGVIAETFYGRMWDTGDGDAAEVHDRAHADAVTDSAYESCSLPPHTDCTYLTQPPGLQLFNCAAQPSPTAAEPLAGATRLVDGFAVGERLRRRAPDAFGFFSSTPLPFRHLAGDVHTFALHRVLELHPATGEVVGFRYNETDRAPLDSLGADAVAAFYAHASALHEAIAALETTVRLRPGEAIVLDNHRTLHGRHAFSGARHLIGCYLTADDWRSRLRVLRARHHNGCVV